MTRPIRNSSKRDGRTLLGIADLLELAAPELRKIGRELAQKTDTRKSKTPKVKP
jgi:hypothetical protein